MRISIAESPTLCLGLISPKIVRDMGFVAKTATFVTEYAEDENDSVKRETQT